MKIQNFGYLFLLLLTSCSSDPLNVDVSGIEVNMKSIRLDQAVFEADWNSDLNQYSLLEDQYGDYLSFYSGFILNNPMNVSDLESNLIMKRFAEDPTMKGFYTSIQELYGGDKFNIYFDEVKQAFRYYSFYFPEERTPNLVLYQSGFNYKIVPNDTLIGIGLEWYLGPENQFVKKLSNQAFPQFEKNKMKSEFLTVDAVKGFLKVKYQGEMEMDNFLSVIIFYGKIQYLTDALLQQKSDASKMNYSDLEFDWMQKNEKEVWTYMAENKLLFENDLRLITQWVNDGPFTNGLPQESPSRVGIYMGWQIVKQYMKKNPDVSMKELLQNKDYNAFLSAYKPK